MEEEIERAKKMGISDIHRVLGLKDLARGQDVMFAATGVTSGDFLKGVRFFGGGATTQSVVMRSKSGTIRMIYLTILFSHTTLAAMTPFLAIRTLYLALKGRFDAHKRIARITWPIWMYVSVTGVVVYWMLYRPLN